ncbi:YueI family protein [Bacillus massiliigorillae]|uniref:YueI family protein n=1 Tax=Bacillus massiliigorillae TaxID=1243664 RepID=UPI0003A69147|nr:YueI family protein [Bacillus massiliigorillae]
MSKKTVDEIIEQGIYGAKEINPDERRKFLGTLRERIVIALTASQVRANQVQPEVEDAIKNNKEAKLYVNGNVDYSYLSKYIKVAQNNNVSYTIVTNKEHNSEIGLVLAYDHAIDKEDIYINENKPEMKPATQEDNSGGFSFLKKWFRR